MERGGLRVRPTARGGDDGVEGRDGGRGKTLPRGGHRRRHGWDWVWDYILLDMWAKCKNEWISLLFEVQCFIFP